MKTPALFLLAVSSLALAAEPPEPKFTAVTLDDKIQIGYGLAIADVDGDKAPDVLLADKRQIVWYRNPGPAKARDAAAWTKHLIAENLTEKDNVCLAAQDLDGDGKCELAVGAEWNPGDTVNSGAVFYLIPPADRTQRWEPVKFPSVEPTTHRMRWLKMEDGKWGLVVVPLHGRGNKNGEGAPVKVLLYHPPDGWPGGNRAIDSAAGGGLGTDSAVPSKPSGEWKSEVIVESMHMTHNFEFIDNGEDGDILFAGREGVVAFSPTENPGRPWRPARIVTADQPPSSDFRGAGEVRFGFAPIRTIAVVEPMHGNALVCYQSSDPVPGSPVGWQRRVLTDKLIEGHALACGDLLGVKSDQIVVGWRGNPAKPDNTFGIHLWTPLDATGEQWRDSAVDDGGMACEDLQLADLDGDGRPDIAASGRATKNVKIYFNDTPR